MAFKIPHIAVIVGLVAAGIALLFQIIAVAAVGWVKAKDADIYLGLWKFCAASTCVELPSQYLSDWFQATRAFSLLGLIFIVIALVVGILIMFIDHKLLPLITGGVACTAASCIVISFAVFAAKRNYEFAAEYTELSYCFALTVVAFVLAIGSGVCFIVSHLLGRRSP